MKKGIKILVLLVMMICAPLTSVRTANASGVSKTFTTSSTKTSKVKAKKKAKRTYSKTKTSTSTKTTQSTTEMKVVKTTTTTTYKYTKGKKVYKKIVKITVETTTTPKDGDVSVSTSASTTSGNGSENYKVYMSKANAELVNAFNALGFTIKVDSGVSYSGYFDAMNQTITLKSETDDTVLHELGHFLSFVAGNADSTSEFAAIFTAEKGKYTAYDKTYVCQNASEFFAEAYRSYVNDPATLKANMPKTYAYIEACLAKVTTAQVNKIATVYASVWAK